MAWVNDQVAAKTLAFVLAGGVGRRLSPLTRYRPKPLVPFGGCFRILDITLSNCLNSKLSRAYVLTQHQSESIAAYLRKGWSRRGEENREFAIPNPAISGKRYTGTADAVLQNVALLSEHGYSFALVVSADHVYTMDYRNVLEFHAASGADVTIGAVDYPKELSSEMGVLEIDNDRSVIAFEEKSRKPERETNKGNTVPVNMGVYVFNHETLAGITKTSDAPIIDIVRDLIPRLLRSHKVRAYRHENPIDRKSLYWRDVGTLQSYYDASMDLLASDPSIRLYDNTWPMRSANAEGFGEDILSGLGGETGVNSVIPNAADIGGAHVYRSVLSPGVVLESGVDVRHSILLPGAVIRHGAAVQRAIIDAHVVIEAGDRIGYSIKRDQARFHVLPNGIVVVSPDHVSPFFQESVTKKRELTF